MSSLPAIATLALLVSGCVLNADHVETELIRVCTSDVPVTLVTESPQITAGSIAVDGIGATVDHPNARATVDSLTIATTDPARDFSFAEEMHLDFIALGSTLPVARTVDAMSTGGQSPWSSSGDSSVDLVGYLTSETLEMRLEITGPAPAQPLDILFSACLDVNGIVIDDK
jgi:hypothetical protein